MQNIDLLDPDIEKKLKGLSEGQSFSVTLEDGETVTYLNPPKPVVCSNHYFEDDGMSGEFWCVKCRHCPNGRIIDPQTHTLKEGKIERL